MAEDRKPDWAAAASSAVEVRRTAVNPLLLLAAAVARDSAAEDAPSVVDGRAPLSADRVEICKTQPKPPPLQPVVAVEPLLAMRLTCTKPSGVVID